MTDGDEPAKLYKLFEILFISFNMCQLGKHGGILIILKGKIDFHKISGVLHLSLFQMQ